MSYASKKFLTLAIVVIGLIFWIVKKLGWTAGAVARARLGRELKG